MKSSKTRMLITTSRRRSVSSTPCRKGASSIRWLCSNLPRLASMRQRLPPLQPYARRPLIPSKRCWMRDAMSPCSCFARPQGSHGSPCVSCCRTICSGKQLRKTSSTNWKAITFDCRIRLRKSCLSSGANTRHRKTH